MKHRLKHVVEYALVRSVGAVARLLPHRGGLLFAFGLGWIAYYLLRWRVDEARRRVREVFGDTCSARDVRRITWLSMRNMCFNAIETMRVGPSTRAWIEQSVTFTGEDKLEEQHEKSGGIISSPHSGNWELSGVRAGMLDIDMFFITGTQHNPLFNEYVNGLRGATGIDTIPRDDPRLVRKVARNLKAGRFLAFTNDVRSRTPALPIRFLGREANIVEGMAVFARMANVPVFPAVACREGWSHHHTVFFDPIFPDPSLDRRSDYVRITQAVMDIFDREIRKHPEQYFWYNKRWVLDPL